MLCGSLSLIPLTLAKMCSFLLALGYFSQVIPVSSFPNIGMLSATEELLVLSHLFHASCCSAMLFSVMKSFVLLFDTECAPRPSMRPHKVLVLDFPPNCYVYSILPCIWRFGTLGSCQFSGFFWAQGTDSLCSVSPKHVSRRFCNFHPSSSL